MNAGSVEFLAASSRRGVNRELTLLVEAAARGDVQVRRDRRWNVYLINGVERPEVRGLMSQLLKNGVLEVGDPDADLSPVVPARGTR